ncbi:MAG: histidine kinase [Coriobacteriia bacterium]|nr:histidine kinase [Coriobacteriia bacterium]
MLSVSDKSRTLLLPRFFSLEAFTAILAIISAMILVWQALDPAREDAVIFVSGMVLMVSVVVCIYLALDPDSVRAHQSDMILKLARQTLSCMRDGLDFKSAQKICRLVMPNSSAIAVAITDREQILAYVGYQEESNPAGLAIRTHSTKEVLRDGRMLVLHGDEIGMPFESSAVKAAIIVPLRQGRRVVGTLKFYYRSPRHITETQKSLAEGFGQLLSTQIAAEALEEQTKLATSMELKALQAQINPHFLFNTVNTIASFVRTDPDRARKLLREFAVFYRHTLEDTGDLVALSREVEQTMRYFYFEIARFGEESLCLQVGFDEDVEDMLIPAFLIQPLVENAVRHARKPGELLTIQVVAEREGSFLILTVRDDGQGMDEEHRQAILHPESRTGLGIAVKNVHDRVEGYFGPGSHMEVESEPGVGTTIRLIMNLESENLKRFMGAEDSEGESTAESAEPQTMTAGKIDDLLKRTSEGESAADVLKKGVGSEATRMQAARAASAEHVSSAEIRAVEVLASQAAQTGLSQEMEKAMSEISQLVRPGQEQVGENEPDELVYEDDDDDWDYEAEMAAVQEAPELVVPEDSDLPDEESLAKGE